MPREEDRRFQRDGCWTRGFLLHGALFFGRLIHLLLGAILIEVARFPTLIAQGFPVGVDLVGKPSTTLRIGIAASALAFSITITIASATPFPLVFTLVLPLFGLVLYNQLSVAEAIIDARSRASGAFFLEECGHCEFPRVEVCHLVEFRS